MAVFCFRCEPIASGNEHARPAEVVAAKDGVWLSITLTLSMALVIGIVRPFAQSQADES